jgi:hypothetical protein
MLFPPIVLAPNVLIPEKNYINPYDNPKWDTGGALFRNSNSGQKEFDTGNAIGEYLQSFNEKNINDNKNPSYIDKILSETSNKLMMPLLVAVGVLFAIILLKD